ncbi:hypothetical protein SNE510_17570 [Streptomyces sp. NE5-10]|uniref:GH12 family glycosyl hydrolase domain-containing protein n=1 Tax=Streptomyces sp. NE5-10 TaxID=2759674 RepID=UPI0019088569|nr:hypothetical protein SNE510_17570 [Streptomyces sp. NE5-10]
MRASPPRPRPPRGTLGGIASAPSAVSYGFVGDAVHHASYDIRAAPTPRTDGVNRTGIMIWFHRNGPVQPIGAPVGTATAGGRSWQVRTDGNGSDDATSFVAPSALAAVAPTGPAALEPWSPTFALPEGQRITRARNAVVTPSSGAVTATGTAHNARIEAGGNRSFGFQGTYGGTFAPPSGFRLNGVACT